MCMHEEHGNKLRLIPLNRNGQILRITALKPEKKMNCLLLLDLSIFCCRFFFSQ